jgi:diguanylate cyclase (GGDEF)-like protein/PAS domain S-box-containing protein
MRDVWLWIAATASGFGIWATQFITMLAYAPGVPNGYNLGLTLLSLFAAILLTGVGLSLVTSRWRGGPWIGGAVVGVGIAATHYIGTAAYEIAARFAWDATLVGASLGFAAATAAIAFALGSRLGGLGAGLIDGALLSLAICGHDLIAMRAARVIPDAAVTVPDFALSPGWIAFGAALASLTILVLACAGLALDIRERHRAKMEVERMRGLADASAEGLLVCGGDKIVTINATLSDLTGFGAAAVVGAPLEGFLPDAELRELLFKRPKQRIEGSLRRANGDLIPAEFILRAIDFAGQKRHAIAIRDLRDRKKAEEHIHFLAHHDSLTGLPNRHSFNVKLDLAIETHKASGLGLAVLCLDLDRFKEVNDQFGHAAGDAVLEKFARSVTAILGPDQILARLGGDEFAIIASNLTDPSSSARLAQAVLEALRSDDAESARLHCVSASIGVAVYPYDGEDREALMTQADTALYRAKGEGRGVYRLFESAMRVEAQERRQMERDIRIAIARNELRVVYQPQSRVVDGEIFGFEALLRWRHPQRGDVSPDVFIRVAEENGAILPIGEWALRTACREATTWARPLNVAVNVSAVQLHHSGFPQLIHEILFQTGLKPQRLELEITETALIRDLGRALATLRQLKTLGVRITMDDFGAGYSSLSNLRAFPFDKIKIDKSFVRSIDSNGEAATIVRAVLGLGRGLGLPVLAEGVETHAELSFLDSESCAEVQGWLIGKPTEIDHFRHLTHPDAKAAEARDPRDRIVLKNFG